MRMPRLAWSIRALGSIWLATGPATVLGAQSGSADPTIEPGWPVDRFVSGRSPLELTLSRPLRGGVERIALVIGTTDVSSLVSIRGTRVRYRPTALRLPSGETEVVASLVDSTGAWRELGRFPLRVRSRLGLDQGRVLPSVDLSSTGQLDQGGTDPTPVARRTYQDVTVRAGLETSAARGGWRIEATGNALGVTEASQRLRFAERQDGAPAFDLSDYRVQVSRGGAQLALGNVSAGQNRYLIDGFASRGVRGSVPLGPIAQLDAAVLNGTNVVGWNNLLGFTAPDHRMATVRLGLELVPSRPGGVHVDLSGLDGSLLPESGYQQGAATDAEESRGVGVQVALSDARQRIRFTGGIARSRFLNPTDPLLAGDTTIVSVRPTTRTARFGELDLQLLQDVAVTGAIRTSLGVALHHERVDPLYRSVGASVQSDLQSNGLDLNGGFGALALQGSIASSRDNLADLPSVLTTRTRNQSINGSLPLGSLFQSSGAWYWPVVTAGWQRVRQAGAGLPTDGGFSDSHVPDQWSTVQTASLAWTRGTWSLGYRWNQSVQDNRQPGREQADFRGTVHGLTLGLSPSPRWSSSLDLSVERQKSFESGTTQRLERLGGSLQWQPGNATSVTGSVSQSWGRDPSAEQRTRNTELQVEVSQGLTLYRRPESGSQGRLFVRFARTRAALLPFAPPSLVAPRIFWTLNAGGSIRLY